LKGDTALHFTEYIGLVAGALIAVSFIPQIVRVYQLKSAREISLLFTVTQLVGLALWLAYGVILGLLPIMVCNSVLAAFVIMLLLAKLKYGRGS
jgi:MtN3 and saliva related transmembrane protein